MAVIEWGKPSKVLTQNDIELIEKAHMVEFPRDYKEQIGSINGSALHGYIMHPDLEDLAYSRNVCINDDTTENVWHIRDILGLPSNIIPFGNSGFGDYYCFDLDKKIVCLWYHETDEVIYICDTFTELLEMVVND